jgi:thiosulfate dehydrogenase
VRVFIFGVILGAIFVLACIYYYFASGTAPAAVSAPAMPFESMLAHKALNARIDKEMPKNVPIQPTQENFAAGAQVYRDNCGVCHSLPGQKESAIALGMYPKPPKLLEGKGVTDDPAGESYWKVANGIRLTGMPGFRDALNETQMWQVSLLVAQADKLPKSVTDSLSAPLTTTIPSTALTHTK